MHQLEKAQHSHEVVLSYHSLNIVQLSGCAIVEVLIIKSTTSMKVPFA